MKNFPNFRVKLIALCSIIILALHPSIAGDDDWPWIPGHNPFETKNEPPETFVEETLRELNPGLLNESEQETEQAVTTETTPSWPPLHNAAATGTFQEVWRELNQAPENIHSQDHLEQTPLHLAAGSGDYNITLLLLKTRADPNARNVYGQTPLGFAVIGGNIPVIELLLRCRANINSRDTKNRTPLYWAIGRGNPAVVRCLIQWGADVNIEYPENISVEILQILQGARAQTQAQEVPPPQNRLIFALPQVFKQTEEPSTNPALPAPPLWEENTNLYLPELPTPSVEPPSITPLRDSTYREPEFSIEDLINALRPPPRNEPPAKRFCRDGSA